MTSLNFNGEKFRYISGLLLILFLLSSCAAEQPLSPHEYYSGLEKIKNLIEFCIYLCQSDYKFRGQMISRLYYAYFHIARLCCYHHYSRKWYNHEATWKNLKKINSREFSMFYDFGYNEIHEYRKKFDYEVYDLNLNPNQEISEAIDFLVRNKDKSDKLFETLKDLHMNSTFLPEEEKRDVSKIDDLRHYHEQLHRVLNSFRQRSVE